MTKQEIFDYLLSILRDNTEIDTSNVKPESRLNEDLNMDSIDAIDLIVSLKPIFDGKRMSPDVFKSVRTVQDVVDAVYGLLNGPV